MDDNSINDEAPEFFAAIDLGSNSFHMVVAQKIQGELKFIDRIKEPVRLADGLKKNNSLSSAAIKKALSCLTRFGERIQNIPHYAIRAVGTNTLRQAKNAEQFLYDAEAILGHRIDIISGIEEARLIYHGIAHNFADDGRARLVLDIGGGSTELIIGKGFQPQLLESLEMGCVNITKRFFSDGIISSHAISHAQLFVQTELEPIVDVYKKAGWELGIGASGTIRALEKISIANQWDEHGLSLTSLRKIRDVISEFSHVDKLKLDGLSKDRQEVILGGLIILLSIFEELDLDFIHVSNTALREGVLYDIMGRMQHENIRSDSLLKLAKRFHVDEHHAGRVATTCHYLYEQVKTYWNIDESFYFELLNWAAQVHEIGLDIAHSQHQKHAAYILEFADLAGFPRFEQKLISVIVHQHRRRLSESKVTQLPKEWHKPMRYLIIILRISVLLHRNRSSEPLPDILLKVKKKELKLEFPENWLTLHRLVVADLEHEKNYLDDKDYKIEFC
ncbi:MAG: exopolyphosphatase [Gammaproteobacteria bacterium]|nr:MAG: exopolyphosphatase [Gammaproteobacteria bacterium]